MTNFRYSSVAAFAALTTEQIDAITTDDLAALSTTHLAALTSSQVSALTTDEIKLLSTAQVAALSTAVIAALSVGQVAAMETDDVKALKNTQVAALTTAQVVALTTDQVVALSTAGIAALTTNQVKAMEAADVAALTTSQMAALNKAGVAALSTDQLAPQMGSLNTAGIAALSTAQVVALTTAQVAALTTAQVQALTTAQVAALSVGQVAAMETDDVKALKNTQVAALTTAQVVALTTDQVVALSTAGIAALTTNQVKALTDTQACALLPIQLGAITAAQTPYLKSTPIIFDLNGDGVKTLGISSGVNFDVFADGENVNTGWVSSGDGLLVLDRNHDGQINDGSELFGSSTTLANGGKAADGYVALRELDSNQDGVISSDDAIYNDLRVWVDGNSDGISGAGETKSLASLGITKINLQATVGVDLDNGNLVGLTSTYETADGATHAAADVWFATDRVDSSTSSTSVDNAAIDKAIAALASPSVVAVEAASINAVNTVKVEALTLDRAEPVLVDVKTDLRSIVSSMAQAIGSFGDSSAAQNLLSGPRLNVSGGVAVTNTAASLAVVSMVDVMKQFDSNGNMLGSQGITTASLGKSLNLPGIQDPASNGFLTVGGK